MTPVEELAEVRARLGRMVDLAEAIPCHEMWTPLWTSYNRRDAVPDFTFIAAANPNLLLRVAKAALGVLDRHFVMEREHLHSGVWCSVDDPCPEVAAVLRAWSP